MANDGVSAKLGEAHIEVRARTDQLNKDLQSTRVQAQQTTDRMKRGFDDVEEQVTFATRALFGLRGTIGTIIAIPLLQELASKIRATADEIEDISVKSKTIGLTTDQFQELSYAARQADVSMEELSTSLNFFAKGFGQAQAGVGPLVEGLKKIDPELANALKGARNMQEALFIVSDAMSSLSSVTDKAAVSTAVFGKSGIGNLRLFGEGSQSLRDAAASARELGQVLDSGQLEKGGELSDAFTEAAAAINTSFKKALIETAPAIIKFIELVASAATGINELISGISRMDAATVSGLGDTFKTLKGELDDIDQRLGNPDIKFEGKAIEDALRKRRDLVIKSLGETQQEIERREELARQAADTKTDKGGTSAHFKPGRKLVPVISDEELKKAADERKSAQDQLREFHIRYLHDTEQLVAAVNAEHEKELANFQEMLNKKLITEDQFNKARTELGEITAKKLAEIYEKELKGTIEAIQTVGKGIEDAFGQWVETGKFSAQEMVRSIIAELAKLTFAQGVINPLFGGGDVKGGGLIGSLIGPLVNGFAFHQGGMVGAGGTPFRAPASLWANAPRFHKGFMPDEYPAILKRNEAVLTPEQMSGMGGMTINVDARGAEVGVETRVVAAIRAMQPELDRNAVAAVGRARQTNPGYLR